MDAQQRYIEVDNSRFDVDSELVEKLKDIPFNYALQIITQLDFNARLLPEKNGWSQKVGGVIKNEEPMFFEVEYLKQYNDIPIYISLQEIDVDDYLDYINLNQILTYECI